MKFAEIIRNAGIDSRQFPNCANIDIHLYDGKDRISQAESICYVEHLFKHNKSTQQEFLTFLSGLESKEIASMNIKVDVDSVVVFYKSPNAQLFVRTPTMDRLDYMD